MAKKIVKEDKTPKILNITGKTSDLCYAELIAADGTTLKTNDGYVPAMMPGQHAGEKPDSHYGDYIILSIDIETGKILNWKKPSKKDIADFIKGRD